MAKAPFLYKIPVLLVYSRLLMAVGILALGVYKPGFYIPIILVLLTLGLLSDIFDGIIARKLKVATDGLRRLDSTVDQIFFLSVVAAAYLHCSSFYTQNWREIMILLTCEALIYLISFVKFRKEVATHTWGAKGWSLLLFGTMVQVFVYCQSTWLFTVCYWVGIVTRLEIACIFLVLPRFTIDVPSFYHALKLRRSAKFE